MRQMLTVITVMIVATLAAFAGVVVGLTAQPSAKIDSALSETTEGSQRARVLGSTISTESLDVSKGNDDPVDLGTQYFKSLDEVQRAAAEAAEKPSAQSYSDILQRIELSDFVEPEVRDLETLESDLVAKLRTQVKVEIDELYQKALSAPNFNEGFHYATEAAGTLALYPMSEDPQIIQEAESMTQRNNEVRFRLESIRRARYNVWAANEIERAIKILRAEVDSYRENSLNVLAYVEPSLLEPSTSAFYGYAIEQLMDEYNDSEKATVAKTLNAPSVERKTLEAF